MKLTAKIVEGLHLPAGKTEVIHWDDDVAGLGLRVREAGSRNWVFQYRVGAKQRRMSIGSATAIKLAKAREIAGELHAKVKLGQDPAGIKAETKQQAAETFGAVARVYLAARKPDMRPSAYDQIDRHLLKYCKALHGLQLAGITQRTIATRINELREEAGTVQANRTRSSLLAFYGWGMRQGIVTSNPVANTGRFVEKARDRVLTDGELREIWEAAGDDHYGAIVKLLMLTGQRAGEIGDLRWPEIGADAIALPAERSKNKRPHLIPLSRPALAIIERQPKRVTEDGIRDFIFGVGKGGFSGWSKSKERIDERIHAARVKAWEEAGRQGPRPVPMLPWVIHDLRRTAATVMAESPYDPRQDARRDPNKRYGLGVAPWIVEAVLGHVSGHKGGVAGVYNHSRLEPQKREALTALADHVMALAGENVTPLRRAAT